MSTVTLTSYLNAQRWLRASSDRVIFVKPRSKPDVTSKGLNV